MRAFVVMSSEMAAADTWAPSDLVSGPDACVYCGLAPVDHTMVKKTRRDPHYALLEPVQVPAWRRAKPSYRCRNRAACARRVSGVRPAPDYDPHVDHPERYTDGPI